MIEVNYELLNDYIDKRVEEKIKAILANNCMTQIPQENKKNWMDIEEASEYLNLSIKTIYTYSNQKLNDPLPFEKFGGKNRYYKEDLDRWAKKRKFNSISNSAIDAQIMTEAYCPNVIKNRSHKVKNKILIQS